jgi:hypothetical protein
MKDQRLKKQNLHRFQVQARVGETTRIREFCQLALIDLQLVAGPFFEQDHMHVHRMHLGL